MRDYKFRGKRRDNGEWVIGKLIANDYILAYIDLAESWGPHTDDHKLTCRAYMINPETVGQFTGLKDKNGKEIFEGDILAKSPNAESRYIAYFSESNQSFTSKFQRIDEEASEENKLYWRTIYEDHSASGALHFGNYIIGNIHELNAAPAKEGITDMTDPNVKTETTETEQGQMPAPTAGEAQESAEGTTEG